MIRAFAGALRELVSAEPSDLLGLSHGHELRQLQQYIEGLRKTGLPRLLYRGLANSRSASPVPITGILPPKDGIAAARAGHRPASFGGRRRAPSRSKHGLHPCRPPGPRGSSGPPNRVVAVLGAQQRRGVDTGRDIGRSRQDIRDPTPTFRACRFECRPRLFLDRAGHAGNVVLDEERVYQRHRHRAEQGAGHQRAPVIDVAVDELAQERHRHGLLLR